MFLIRSWIQRIRSGPVPVPRRFRSLLYLISVSPPQIHWFIMPPIEVGNLFGIPYTVLIITLDTDIRRNQIWAVNPLGVSDSSFGLWSSQRFGIERPHHAARFQVSYIKNHSSSEKCVLCTLAIKQRNGKIPHVYFGWFSQIDAYPLVI